MNNRSNRNIAEIMKDEMVMRNRILSILREEAKTIPELAGAIEYPGEEIMFWIMAMWRYGLLKEVGKPNAEGYYKYRAVE